MDIRKYNFDFGKELASWEAPEYPRHKHSFLWYITYSITISLILVYAVKTNNYPFAFIVLICFLLLIFQDSKKPQPVKFVVTEKGFITGISDFHPYKNIKYFAYIKNAEKIFFKAGGIKPNLLISLPAAESEKIKQALLNYVKENDEIVKEPFEDRIVQWLKL